MQSKVKVLQNMLDIVDRKMASALQTVPTELVFETDLFICVNNILMQALCSEEKIIISEMIMV